MSDQNIPTPADIAPARPSNHEAARYRTQLRAVESERDTLAARVRDLQTAGLESVLPAHVPAAALWAVTDLDALVSADGRLDRDLFDQAVAEAEARFDLAPGKLRVSTNGNRSGYLVPVSGASGVAAVIQGPGSA